MQKRRIYDITNVLEGIGIIAKISKNTVELRLSTPRHSSCETQTAQFDKPATASSSCVLENLLSVHASDAAHHVNRLVVDGTREVTLFVLHYVVTYDSQIGYYVHRRRDFNEYFVLTMGHCTRSSSAYGHKFGVSRFY